MSFDQDQITEEVDEKDYLRCVVCPKERFMYKGLQSVFCSYKCFNKWKQQK